MHLNFFLLFLKIYYFYLSTLGSKKYSNSSFLYNTTIEFDNLSAKVLCPNDLYATTRWWLEEASKVERGFCYEEPSVKYLFGRRAIDSLNRGGRLDLSGRRRRSIAYDDARSQCKGKLRTDHHAEAFDRI